MLNKKASQSWFGQTNSGLLNHLFYLYLQAFDKASRDILCLDHHPGSHGLISAFINKDHTSGDSVFAISINKKRFCGP